MLLFKFLFPKQLSGAASITYRRLHLLTACRPTRRYGSAPYPVQTPARSRSQFLSEQQDFRSDAKALWSPNADSRTKTPAPLPACHRIFMPRRGRVRTDLATLERIHECGFRPVWSPSRACTCSSCIGAAPAGTLRPRTGPEPRCRPLPAPSIRCRRSGPLLL